MASAIVVPKRFTLTEYHRLIELGFLSEADRVELIYGEIVHMVAKGRAHETCNRKLMRELLKLLGDRATLQNQSPISFPDDSEPEPDFAIIRNREDDYLSAHPLPGDVLLMIEVSDSSVEYDQTVKLRLYAESKIQHYWIFNLLGGLLETYSEPYRKPDGTFGYRLLRTFLPQESVTLSPWTDLNLDLALVFPVVR
jgi:Uma2 family endonuclease